MEAIRQNDSWSLSIELVANTFPRGADFCFYTHVQFHHCVQRYWLYTGTFVWNLKWKAIVPCMLQCYRLRPHCEHRIIASVFVLLERNSLMYTTVFCWESK